MRLIHLNFKISYLSIFCSLIIICLLTAFINQFSTIKIYLWVFIIIIYSVLLYKLLTVTNFSLDLINPEQKLILWQKNKAHLITQIKHYPIINNLFSVFVFKTQYGAIWLPISIDNLGKKQYKILSIYQRWL